MRGRYLLIAILLLASLLRVWKLDTLSLFGDELDVGYHALSILETGRDYKGNFMPIQFQSLAEYRTPLYIYSVVPTVALFGISPLGVRLPAVFFGVLGIYVFYLLTKALFNERVATLGALVMAVSPWHLQYSRAAFEVTQMLFFLLLGLYLFLKSLKEHKYLWVSMASFALTPWIYNTAKLFAPLVLVFLFFFYKKEILKVDKKNKVLAVIALLVVGLPIAINTLGGQGVQRFEVISILSRPGALGQIVNNIYQTFSTDFLFVKGDLILRHSVDKMGMFFKVEALALMVGLVALFGDLRFRSLSRFLGFWLAVGMVPAALTMGGGNHATRLILILPPLIMLIALGLSKLKPILLATYFVLLAVSFAAYLHNYYVHNVLDSQRWWHSGWREAVLSIKAHEREYDKIVISMTKEPAWIFFAGHYEYDPVVWQNEFPQDTKTTLEGFGEVGKTGKFYFGSPQGPDAIYSLGDYLSDNMLYLANASEIGTNLIHEPEKVMPGIKLIEAIPFPSGEPAFYLLAKEQ